MRQSDGFTLIEVLVAATILFLVVTTAMMSFQTAMDGSQKAGRFLQMTKAITPIQESIRQQLREQVQNDLQKEYQGSGTFAGTEYRWRALQIESRPPPERFDPEREALTEYQDRYHLYRIELTLLQGSLRRTFEYEQLAWSDRVRVQR